MARKTQPQKKTSRGKYPERVETTVSPKLKRRLQNCADAEGLSVATYVRRLLRHHVPAGV